MAANKYTETTGQDGRHQFLTFCLGNEEYGIEILDVQEIKGYSPVTPIPNAPAHVKGLMNLRGAVVPVVDLRARFGMSAQEYTPFTVIIVVKVGQKVVGLIVDAVSDVLDVDPAQLEATPDCGATVDTSFLTGLAHAGERLIGLLEVERVAGVGTGQPENS
ncbi:MAG: chemotaxis protein CheW [Candidatus Eisenbacteria bacterium]